MIAKIFAWALENNNTESKFFYIPSEQECLKQQFDIQKLILLPIEYFLWISNLGFLFFKMIYPYLTIINFILFLNITLCHHIDRQHFYKIFWITDKRISAPYFIDT